MGVEWVNCHGDGSTKSSPSSISTNQHSEIDLLIYFLYFFELNFQAFISNFLWKFTLMLLKIKIDKL